VEDEYHDIQHLSTVSTVNSTESMHERRSRPSKSAGSSTFESNHSIMETKVSISRTISGRSRTFFLDLPIKHDPSRAHVEIEVCLYEDLGVGQRWADTGIRSNYDHCAILAEVVPQAIGSVK
jgi:hypothetical protein